MCGQGRDDRIAASPTAQLPERFQHRVIRFHAAIALQALPACQAQGRDRRRGLLLEGVDQGSFPDARFPSDQDELPLTVHGPVQTRAQRLQLALTSHQVAGR